jgi:hypothetical protein
MDKTPNMVNDERDEDTGKFEEKYDDDDFVAAIRDFDGAAGTADVADAVGCPHSTAYHRLDRLRDDGRIDSRQVGNAVLWVADDG